MHGVIKVVDNLVKARDLLKKHGKSEFHLATVQQRTLSQSTQEHVDVVDIKYQPVKKKEVQLFTDEEAHSNLI